MAAASAGQYAVWTTLQTDNHTNTSSLNFYRPDALPDTQPCKSTEGQTKDENKPNLLATYHETNTVHIAEI